MKRPDGAADDPPVLRVIRGDATAEEMAAVLVAMVAVRRAAGMGAGTGSQWGSGPGRGSVAHGEPASVWGHRFALRAARPVAPEPGPDAWRTSFWGR